MGSELNQNAQTHAQRIAQLQADLTAAKNDTSAAQAAQQTIGSLQAELNAAKEAIAKGGDEAQASLAEALKKIQILEADLGKAQADCKDAQEETAEVEEEVEVVTEELSRSIADQEEREANKSWLAKFAEKYPKLTYGLTTCTGLAALGWLFGFGSSQEVVANTITDSLMSPVAMAATGLLGGVGVSKLATKFMKEDKVEVHKDVIRELKVRRAEEDDNSWKWKILIGLAFVLTFAFYLFRVRNQKEIQRQVVHIHDIENPAPREYPKIQKLRLTRHCNMLPPQRLKLKSSGLKWNVTPKTALDFVKKYKNFKHRQSVKKVMALGFDLPGSPIITELR